MQVEHRQKVTTLISTFALVPDAPESKPKEPNTERPPGDWQGPVEDPDPQLKPLRDPEIDVPPEDANDDDTEGTIVV